MPSVAELVLHRMHGEKHEEPETEEEKGLGPNGVGMVAAMEEFRTAMNEGKPSEMAKCLSTFFELCETQPHEEAETEEPDNEPHEEFGPTAHDEEQHYGGRGGYARGGAVRSRGRNRENERRMGREPEEPMPKFRR